MIRSVAIGFVALLIGLIAGWKARDITSDGHDGIQWKFSDAAGRGDVAEMKRLISMGADPVAIPSYADGAVSGATALLEAASAGEADAVEFLISLGADVRQQESDTTPIDSANYRLRQTEATIQILNAHIADSEEGDPTKQKKNANPKDSF